MKLAIIWICAIASLCGSIEGSVLRHDGSKRGQVVESVTRADSEEDSTNAIAEYFDASNEELQPNNEPNLGGARTTTENVKHFEPTPETTTEYKYKELLEPYVNRLRSTTRRPVDPEQLLAEIPKNHPKTTRPRSAISTKTSAPTPELKPETTTEYKYKELLEPYVNRRRSTTRRPVDPEQLLAEILKKSRRTSSTTPEPTPETTTEYKYKDLVEAYTIAQPKYVPMKHVAGTHYVKVDRGQDEHERVMEDYNRLFKHGSYPVQRDYSAPPKI